MKKFYRFSLGLFLVVSILGGNLIFSAFETVPVTVVRDEPATAEPSFVPSPVVSQPVPAGSVAVVPDTVAQAQSTDVLPPSNRIAGAVERETPNPTATSILPPTPFATQVAGISATREEAPAIIREEPLGVVQTPSPLDRFAQTVLSQEAGLVTGVYVEGRFALPVLQQPMGETGFVASQDNTVTQFSPPKAYGNIGLLAHNYLSGKRFFDLQLGDEVRIVYGSGKNVQYRINRIERYQALTPTSVYSNFIDLSDGTQTVLTSQQVFQRIYTVPDRVVFQTCIEAYGDPSWGRIFVIAERVTS